jgi:hypothetical protein
MVPAPAGHFNYTEHEKHMNRTELVQHHGKPVQVRFYGEETLAKLNSLNPDNVRLERSIKPDEEGWGQVAGWRLADADIATMRENGQVLFSTIDLTPPQTPGS